MPNGDNLKGPNLRGPRMLIVFLIAALFTYLLLVLGELTGVTPWRR